MVEVESFSLSVQARKVYRLFASACENKSAVDSKDGRELQDAFERFRLWAGNVGAFQNDTRSLDHRTRNALLVKKRLLELLTELEDLLHQHSDQDQKSHRLPSMIEGELNDAEDTSRHESVSQRDAKLLAELEGFITSQECQSSWISSGITDIITRLFKMSAQLAKSTVTDRYAKAEAARGAKLPFDYDIAHVKEKFRESTGESWLMERLGMAITKRRQYLIYCQKHREKLAKEPPFVQPISNLPDVAIFRASPTESRSAVISRHTKDTRPSALPTTASTLVPAMAEVVDDGFDDARSLSTVATSVSFPNDKNALQVPALTDFARPGEYFECPYCRTMRRFNGQSSWKQHVFADIRPYLCTFADCGLLMFDSRRAWIDHELQHHRRQWSCQLCDKNGFKDQLNLQSHLSNAHPSSQNVEMLSYMQQTVPMELVPATDCFLCDWNSALCQQNSHAEANDEMSVTTLQLMNHLARHLEQLALFALPRVVEDESAASLQVAGSRETYQDLSSTFSIDASQKKDKMMWSAEAIAQIRIIRTRLIAFKQFNDLLTELRLRNSAIHTPFKVSSWHAFKVKLLAYARFNSILVLLRQDDGVLQTTRRVFDGRLPGGFLLWSAASQTYPARNSQDVKLRILDEREHLAAFCHETKKWYKAQEVESAILSSRLEMYGPRHDATIKCVSRLGEALHELGRYSQELDLHLKLAVLTMRETGWENEEAIQSLKRLVTCSKRLAHSPWSSLTANTADFEKYFWNSLETCLRGLSKELRVSISATIACSFYQNGDPARGELMIPTLMNSQLEVVRTLLGARNQAIGDLTWLSQTEAERATRYGEAQNIMSALLKMLEKDPLPIREIIQHQNDLLELLNNPQHDIAEWETRRVPFRAILQPDIERINDTPLQGFNSNSVTTGSDLITDALHDQNRITEDSAQETQEAEPGKSGMVRRHPCAVVECEYHTKGFRTKAHAERHTATHFKGTLLCTFCSQGSYPSFPRVDQLARHLIAEHSAYGDQNSILESSPGIASDGRFQQGSCYTCETVYSCPETFAKHLQCCVNNLIAKRANTHSMKKSNMTDDETCVNCRRTHITYLEAHLCEQTRTRPKEATEPSRCDLCSEDFGDSNLRDRHEQEVHCHWQCLNLSSCRRSIDRAMSKSFMLWTCWYCGQNFKRSEAAILRHLMQVHSIKSNHDWAGLFAGYATLQRHAMYYHAAVDGPHLELLKAVCGHKLTLTESMAASDKVPVSRIDEDNDEGVIIRGARARTPPDHRLSMVASAFTEHESTFLSNFAERLSEHGTAGADIDRFSDHDSLEFGDEPETKSDFSDLKSSSGSPHGYPRGYQQATDRVPGEASANDDVNGTALELMKVIRQELQQLHKAVKYSERALIQSNIRDAVTKLLANSAIVQRRSPEHLKCLESLDEDMTSHDFNTNPLGKEAAWRRLTRKVCELLDGSSMDKAFISQHTQALLRILEYYRSNLKDMDQHDGSNAVVTMPEMNYDGIEFSSRATLMSNKTIDETRFLPKDFHHRPLSKRKTRSQSQSAIKTLHGYILRPVSRESGLDDDWASSTVIKTLDTYHKLEQMASEHRRNGASPAQMLAEMLPHSREAVIKLLADARHKERYPLAKWSLYDMACFKEDVSRSMFRTDRVIVGLHVILSRDVDYDSKPLVTSAAVDHTEPLLLSLDNQPTSIVSFSRLESKKRGLTDAEDAEEETAKEHIYAADESDVSSSDEVFVPIVSLKALSTGQIKSDADDEEFKKHGKQNKNGSWSCAYPGCTSRATFVRASDLRKHYNRHTKSFFCRYEGCRQATEGGFSSKKDRLRHEARHNPMIECEDEGCNRVFSRVDNMRDHVRRVHRKQKSTVSGRISE